MNFYRAQDQARKQTFWLIFLFSLSVIFLVILTNLCVAWFVWHSDLGNLFNNSTSLSTDSSAAHNPVIEVLYRLGWTKALWVTGLVCGVIGIAIYFKWSSLKSGGRVVAESLGGQALVRESSNLAEKRLLNIVEEMALASGIPAPPVYILKSEMGINAFAAGLETEDAVIGVTQGALDYLNREQLQGVIAHEFSHILNGDMRLNTQVVAVLHGILMIGEAGRNCMSWSRSSSYSHSRRQQNGLVVGLFFFGLCLYLIGAMGQFFGALIKAAVSRQREYLADASAVQFTRNPDGIGGALQVIGGYTKHARLTNHHAHELGHFFFCQAYLQRIGWLATHPPLKDRIQRVLPKWNGQFLQAHKLAYEETQNREETENNAKSMHQGLTQDLDEAIPFVSALNTMRSTTAEKCSDQNSSPSSSDQISTSPLSIENTDKSLINNLTNKTREVYSANALIVALLLSQNKSVKAKQARIINGAAIAWRAEIKSIHSLLCDTNRDLWLTLIEQSIPTLKTQSSAQYQQLKQLMFDMIHADGKIDLREWVIYQIVTRYCGRHYGLEKSAKPKYRQIKPLLSAYQLVLSVLIYQSENKNVAHNDAMIAAAQAAGCPTVTLLPKDQCTLAEFSKAVRTLAGAFPLIKPRLLKGLIAAARVDQILETSERELIKAIAVVLDCPVAGIEPEHIDP